MSDEKNPREDLYNRFKLSLTKPVSERFFDEDELVEIYDYAGDISDDYVQMEALFCGARLYPESQALMERRALLYIDTSIDDSDAPSPAAGKYLNDNADTFSPIFDIARLQINHPDDPEAALEFLLTQYDHFNDEEIIRFVNLAFDLNCYSWVVENLDRLRKYISYQPVLVYEVMREADDVLDNDLTAKLAEELIESEPFSVGYWEILFKAQARAGKENEARSTFDYAKALAADDPEMQLVLAGDVYNYAPFLYRESLEMLEALKADDPDRFEYTDCQCATLVKAGLGDRAVRVLIEFIETHPDHERAMRQLMLCNIHQPGKYLDNFYVATDGRGFGPEVYAELVNVLSMNSAMRSLEAMLERSDDITNMDPNDFSAYLEALFARAKYQLLVDTFEAYKNADVLIRIPLRGTAALFAYMVSLMKLGRQPDAEAIFNAYHPYYDSVIIEAPMPVRMAIRNLYTLADKIRRHPASEFLYWEYFDMLHYGKFL